jgi:hypothetical protein
MVLAILLFTGCFLMSVSKERNLRRILNFSSQNFSYRSFGASSTRNMAANESELTASFVLADATILQHVTIAISQYLLNF